MTFFYFMLSFFHWKLSQTLFESKQEFKELECYPSFTTEAPFGQRLWLFMVILSAGSKTGPGNNKWPVNVGWVNG